MPLATDKQWVKQYGQLPWWRGSDYLKKLLKQTVESSTAIKKNYAGKPVEALKKGETIEFGPDGKRGILKKQIVKLVKEHPGWNKEQIKAVLNGEEIEEQSEEKVFSQADQPEFTRSLTSYERKVDFAVLDSETKKLATQGTDRIKRLLAESRDKLMALIASRYKAGSLSAKFVLDLELRGLGQLIPTLREVLGTSFRLGQREAGKELKKTFAQYASDFDEAEHPREDDGKFASGGGEDSRVTDVAQVQEIENSIAEGQLILRSGKSNGKSLTTEQLWAVRKQVERDLAKIGKSRLAGKSRIGVGSSTITDVTPEGYGPKYTRDHSYQVKLDPTGLPPEKALEFFERKAILWGADIRQPLLGEVKNILFDGIKQGTPLRELMTRIRDAYLPWLGDPDQAIDEIMLTPYRLETLVRTNITEALNEGRKAQFQSAVDDGFVIGLQYSAIMDARTTDVCRHLDEKIFPANSSDLDRLTPPRHFSCRSVLVPVTRMEGPVQYITQSQVAKGIELSGKGFGQDGESRQYEFNEEDHPRVPAGEEGGGQFTSGDGGGGEEESEQKLSLKLESVLSTINVTESTREKIRAAFVQADAGFSQPKLTSQEIQSIDSYSSGNVIQNRKPEFLQIIEKGKVLKDITVFRAGKILPNAVMSFSLRESWARQMANDNDLEFHELHLKKGDSALFVPFYTSRHAVETEVLVFIKNDSSKVYEEENRYTSDFDESEHPREDDGKFAPKGSGESSSNAKSEDAIRAVGTGKERTFINADGSPVDEATQARINALGIPPGWTGVQVSADPQSPLQAIGYDASGKEQPRYSKEHTTAANAAKHLRVAALAQDGYKKMVQGVASDLNKGVEEAIVMSLVLSTAMRIGGDSEKAIGATTLEAQHLSVDGDMVRFDFPGKSGKRWEGTIRNERLAKQISTRLVGKSSTDRVFSSSASKVNSYLKQYGKMSAKDVRTLQGTSVAMKELKQLGEPKTLKEAKQHIKIVSTKVSEHLRNTPATAKKHYINPAVWAPIQAKFGIQVVA